MSRRDPVSRGAGGAAAAPSAAVGVRLADTLSTPEFSQACACGSSFDRDDHPETVEVGPPLSYRREESASASRTPPPVLSRRVASVARQLRASHSYTFVLLLILFAFAFAATAPDVPWSRGALVLIECGTLLMALWTSRGGPLRLRLAPLVLLTMGIGVAQIVTDNKGLTTVAGTFGGLLVIAIGVVIVRGVISEGMVSQRSVIGAICVYFLLGMLFLFVYGDVALLQSGPFFAQAPTARRLSGSTSAS